MKKLINIAIIALTIYSCESQTKDETTKIVGGRCEGCEALLEYGDKKLSNIDTLPKFEASEPKLKITGTVYQKDGKTPASNIILYIYHTNENGIYETKGDEKGWAKRHGYIRGWIKTNSDGSYTFYTFRPSSYPNTSAPQHIHMTVKEPNTNAYYVDDIMFEDDKFLTNEFKERLGQRAGSGVVLPKMENGILHVKRDVILGRNIPDYD
ncbi:intradiol ring-cleavage dioxygenase [Winogradskyella ouciana]|uniref:Intradiol ring-cleavage dioxygenase n=1 Tax=Winogradskyella ouciana TaxID=2608631 RepID=A0A7K1GF35_9FLAO|nr:intradiol ring-cleavage dioxygenase [Winogradskyella ouciana]MTE27743.1 intradiol ring-cleavage dioxygenase [Winogradskyella ouciana]